MLCEQNDDIICYTLFIACIAACEKVNTPWAGRSVDAARTQGGELACILEAKVGICQWLVQRKGHTVGLLPVWQNISKRKQSLFAHYLTTPMLLAFNSVKCYIDANSCLWHHSFVTFVHFKLYLYSIKITLATGRLKNIDKLTSD